MNGCFRNILAGVGCLAVLLVGGIVAWQYRAQIAGAWRSIVGTPGSSAVAARAVGRPSPRALQSAEMKELAISRPDGPGYVTLTAEEMASIIDARLDPLARQALDSVTVTLSEARFVLEGTIRTDLFSRDVLGPFADMLDSRQPLRLAGPARLAEPGKLLWAVDEVMIRSFPFPESAIPRMVDKLTGGGEGAFIIRVPETVGDVRIRPDGVTFYRKVE
jgi:hypothetical protein